MKDLFDKIDQRKGALGQVSADSGHDGYFFFPKLEGEIKPRMKFMGKEQLTWSLNNYLGLGNHPEVRKTDAKASIDFGLAHPMGARMLTGNTENHIRLEKELSEFVRKPATILCNYGYQAMFSAIDALVDRHDIIIYDSESHACIIDGTRLHMGRKFSFTHNDIDNLERQLKRASIMLQDTDGSILVITEGVFGMRGDQGKLKEIVELKKKYSFRLFVDDAHGLGTMGETGAGTGEEQGVQDGIDIYFGTFAKTFALIGGFLSSTPEIINHFRFNLRSQIYAKSLPTPIVLGALKRLELMRKHPEYREKLWEIVNALQSGLIAAGMDIGNTNTPVIPVYMKGSLQEASQLAFDLRENHRVFCSIIIPPVIPQGMIILRLIPTAAHTLEDVDYTIKAFSEISSKLNNGEYSQEEWADLSQVNG